MTEKTRFLLVLHGHLPDVVGHGTWPHGANWLYEAAAECYLPFLRNVHRLLAEGIPVRATVGITPVLGEQLLDPRFATGLRWYLRQRARAAAEDREYFTKARKPRQAQLAESWRLIYGRLREEFESLPGHDLLAAFRRLADAGVLEPIACAATHGFLPLLPDDRAIERQLDVGLAAHARHFGKPAKGIWIPECAYRPGGAWTSPADGHVEERKGIEELLAARGVEFFFVETHLVRGGVTYPAYGGRVERDENGGTPYRMHVVKTKESGRPVAVLARDPLSSEQVWSGKVGYPGDGRYLEFHKKKEHSGHRYWRVTDSRLDLPEKLLYHPEVIGDALRSHASHFVSLLEAMGPLSDGSPAVVVGMFDFELFGHWWFEGPDFLQEVFRRIAVSPNVEAVTVSEARAQTPPSQVIEMPPGTWGRNGTFEVWWNEHTVGFWKLVTDAEARMEAFESRPDPIPPRLLAALERQILLLQSSDWPFLIDNAVSRDYAEERVTRHATDFDALATMAESGLVDEAALDEITRRDHLFAEELGDASNVAEVLARRPPPRPRPASEASTAGTDAPSSPAPPASGPDFEIRQAEPRPTMSVRGRVERAEITTGIRDLLLAAGRAAAAAGARTGRPFTRYHADLGPAVDLEGGLFVEAPFDGSGLLPGGDVAVAVHLGPYESLDETSRALARWAEGRGRTGSGPGWQVYVTDPGQEPDRSLWRTDVFLPLAPAEPVADEGEDEGDEP